MTREEEICNTIKDLGICGYKYDDLLSNNEYSAGDIQSAFIEGAEWADNHPVNVWHDAIEKPKIGSNIVVINGNNKWWDIQPYDGDYSWTCCVHTYDIQRWAYIDDILPKGGKK